MMNPFRKKTSSSSNNVNSGNNNNQQRRGLRGIVIGSTASPSAAAPSSNGLQASIPNPNQLENGMPSANHQAQNSLALPPESDYRTSLIMPHLTRRFTLLRAPDGTMVTPDAMRAHLRAQRARARARNTAVGAPELGFLTEQEENEIIEQLKAQSRDEDYEEGSVNSPWNSVSNNGEDWTNSGYGSGTDGFGSWGGTTSNVDYSKNGDGNGSNNGSSGLGQIHESISEGLNSQTSPTGRGEDGIGGLFSSRSASRDNAYIRSVDKQRSKGLDNPTEPIIQESQEEEDEEEEPMPGDFLAATKRSSQNPHPSSSPRSSPVPPQMTPSSSSGAGGLHPDRALNNSSPHSASSLLTTLSPEAFKRVSTALEEVFGMVSGEIPDDDDGYDEDQEEEIREDENREINPSYHLRRTSQDSDERSFASAASDLIQSTTTHTRQSGDDDEIQDVDDEEEEGDQSRDQDQQLHSEQMMTSDSIGTILGAPSSDDRAYQDDRTFQRNPQVGNQIPPQVMERPATPPNQETTRLYAHSSSSPPSSGRSQTASSFGGKVNNSHSPNGGGVGMDALASSSSSGFSGNQRSPNLSHSRSGNSLTDSSYLHQQQQQSNQAMHPRARSPSINSVTSGYSYSGQGQGGSSHHRQRSNQVSLDPANGRFKLGPSSPNSSTFNNQSLRKTPSLGSVSDVNNQVYGSSPNNGQLSRENSTSSNRDTGSGSFQYDSASNGYASRIRQNSGEAISKEPIVNEVEEEEEEEEGIPDGFGGVIKPLGRNGTQRQQQQQQQQQQPSTKPVMKIPLDGVPQGDWRRPSLPTDGSSSPAISGMSSPVSVISANAIAARSQNYFPPSSAQSMGAYATGFKPSVRGAGANANGSRPESSSTAESHRSPIAGQAGSSTETAGTSYVGHTQDSISNLNNSAYSNNNSGSGGGGLMPRPPADPEQAERWRQTYGAKTADAASIRSSSDVSGVSDDEEDGEGDVWAKVRDSKSNSKGSKSSRPISHLPPRAAESQLASSGMTMDKLAEMQSNLVRSASQKGVTSKPRNQSTEQEAMPSPPTTTTTTTVDSLQRSTSVSSPPSSPPDRSRSPAQAAASSPAIAERLEKARARAKQIAQDQAARAAATAAAASGSNPSSASSPLVASPIGHGSSPSQGLNQKSSTSSSRYAARSVDERDQPSPPAPTTTAEAPSSHPQKSAVMYDVTSSHRPTSPPPPPRAMSPPNALPNLRDLGGFQPLPSVHRESVSLSQALEQAGHTPSQSINSLEDSRGEIRTEYDRSQGSLPFPNSGLSSAVYEEDELAFNDSGPFGNDAPGLPRSQSHNALASAANNQATTSTPDQNRWSDPGRDEFQPKYMTPQLLDDVASQARAATRALKGVDNETFPLPPRRSKTLSKAKSSRKLAKAISTPQLISTTQRLDHTTNLNTVYGAKAAAASRRPVPDTRTRAAQAGWPQTPSSPATDYREDGKPKVAKQGTHRRRSSSFGHQGQLDALFAQEASNEAGLRSPSSGQGQMSSMTLPRQTPPGTASPGGRQPGSIGRLVSRLTQRGRKQSEGTPNIGGTIDPFPTNKSTPTLPSPYHNEHDSPALPFHSAQATPDRNFGSEGAQKLVGLFDTQGGASPVAPRREGSLRKGKSNLQSERVPAVPGLGSPASIQGGWSSVSAQQQPSQAAAFDQGKLSSEVVDQNNESFNQTSESSFLADDEAGISNRDSINAAELFLKNSGDEAEESSKVQNRKSARDTIVRRTLIFPNPELIEDRRKSSLSVASNSRRKSRRPPMEEPAPLPITKSNSFKGHDRTASTGSSAGRRSIHDRPATPPGPAGAGGGHRRKPSNEVPVDQPVPRIPSRLSKQGQSLGTNFEQGGNERLSTLVPPSPSSPANRRASQAQSSYAGSLYDMYIGDDEPDSQRQSRFPPNGTRNHIEVTERADGSVVWQVIAGLADQRASTYSDSYAPNHSRHASDASNFSGNDLDFARDSYASGEGNDPSPRGQTADLEDGRSLFAGRRGHNTSHKKQSSLDIAIPPLPTMPQVAREGGSGSDQFPGDESNSTTSPTKPAWDYGPASSSSTSRLPKGASSSSLSASTSRKSQVRSPQHLGFEMATSPNGDVGTNPTSPTRIVYTSDAELAQMLESLARGQDSAKFDVRWAGAGSSSPTPSLGRERTPSPHIQSTRDRPSSSFTGGSGMSMDVDQQRQRVEQEIYSLLQQENSSPNNVY